MDTSIETLRGLLIDAIKYLKDKVSQREDVMAEGSIDIVLDAFGIDADPNFYAKDMENILKRILCVIDANNGTLGSSRGVDQEMNRADDTPGCNLNGEIADQGKTIHMRCNRCGSIQDFHIENRFLEMEEYGWGGPSKLIKIEPCAVCPTCGYRVKASSINRYIRWQDEVTQ